MIVRLEDISMHEWLTIKSTPHHFQGSIHWATLQETNKANHPKPRTTAQVLIAKSNTEECDVQLRLAPFSYVQLSSWTRRRVL